MIGRRFKSRGRFRNGGGDDAAGADAGGAAASDWFDQEPSLQVKAWVTVRRLGRRAFASWPVWMGLCLVISAAMTVRAARRAPLYSATVLLRVTQGPVDVPGSELRTKNLQWFVDNLVFSTKNLIAYMEQHPKQFPAAAKDPVSEVHEFRDHLDVAVTGNEVTFDDDTVQAPRSARIAITFRNGDAQRAWDTAKELGDLVIDVAHRYEHGTLEREAAGAAAAAQGAEELEARRPLAPAAPADSERRLPPEVDPLRKAQQEKANVDFGLHALEQERSLLFSVIDVGHVPLPRDPLWAAVATFVTVFIGSTLGACLLVGAFDPRVVDGEDMMAIGFPILARFPGFPRKKQGTRK